MKQGEMNVWDGGGTDKVGVTYSTGAWEMSLGRNATKKSEKILLRLQD
jgi:hypothetical protein